MTSKDIAPSVRPERVEGLRSFRPVAGKARCADKLGTDGKVAA
jgi:hypothetical protein